MDIQQAQASRHRGVSFAPAPGWADFRPFERPASPSPDLASHGVITWVVDDVCDLTGPVQVWASRSVREVATPEGLQGVASFDVGFDPAYERVVLHHVRVTRGGVVRDVLADDALQVLRREADLERAIYDGRLNVHLIIPDIRVGDVVETSHSLYGAHPVLKGRFSAAAQFQWHVPVDFCRFRVLAREGRTFSGRYWGKRPAHAERRLPSGAVEHAWIARGFEPFRYEPGVPIGWTGHSALLLSDRMSWAEVASLYRAAYALPTSLPPDLEAAAAQIEAAEPTLAGRAAAALKRVQGDIRYLAFSLGEGGLVPRPVHDIWASRFGDCKDVSRLLTALLTRLGVEACPALVHTALGRDLWESPPSPLSFNHCIVRARVDGRTYWLDATRPVQGGRLERLDQARFGYALPLVERAALEPMGEEQPQTLFETTHRFALGRKRADPASFEAVTVYRGWRADDMRARLRAQGLKSIREAFVTYYENHFGATRTIDPLAVVDDEPENVLTMTERYDLLEPWRTGDDPNRLYFSTLDEVMSGDLNPPNTHNRTQPVGLGDPRRARQLTIVSLPEPWQFETWDDRTEIGGYCVASACRQADKGRRLELESVVETRTRSVPAEKARLLFTTVDRARRSAALTLSNTVVNGEFVRSGAPANRGSDWVVWIWRVLLFGWIAWLAIRYFFPA